MFGKGKNFKEKGDGRMKEAGGKVGCLSKKERKTKIELMDQGL